MAENPNMRIYEAVRFVPDQAKKKITGGRLAGMTDINSMWRIKVLTEQFGPCGEGWYTSDVKYWQDRLDNNGSVALFCSILLNVKIDGAWSQPIYGIGGNTLVAAEKSGLRIDDEAYKKAYTDAISVACKALGIGADVYFEKDVTKYSEYEYAQDKTAEQQIQPQQPTTQQTKQQSQQNKQPVSVDFDYKASLLQYANDRGLSKDQFSALRAACIAGGAVPDIHSSDMTQKDWETLFRAIDEQIAKAS